MKYRAIAGAGAVMLAIGAPMSGHGAMIARDHTARLCTTKPNIDITEHIPPPGQIFTTIGKADSNPCDAWWWVWGTGNGGAGLTRTASPGTGEDGRQTAWNQNVNTNIIGGWGYSLNGSTPKNFTTYG
jgi:hypothetical protein